MVLFIGSGRSSDEDVVKSHTSSKKKKRISRLIHADSDEDSSLPAHIDESSDEGSTLPAHIDDSSDEDVTLLNHKRRSKRVPDPGEKENSASACPSWVRCLQRFSCCVQHSTIEKILRAEVRLELGPIFQRQHR